MNQLKENSDNQSSRSSSASPSLKEIANLSQKAKSESDIDDTLDVIDLDKDISSKEKRIDSSDISSIENNFDSDYNYYYAEMTHDIVINVKNPLFGLIIDLKNYNYDNNWDNNWVAHYENEKKMNGNFDNKNEKLFVFNPNIIECQSESYDKSDKIEEKESKESKEKKENKENDESGSSTMSVKAPLKMEKSKSDGDRISSTKMKSTIDKFDNWKKKNMYKMTKENKEKSLKVNNSNDNNNGFNANMSEWAESFGILITQAKHRLYTLMANPISASRAAAAAAGIYGSNRHKFNISNNNLSIVILGNEYSIYQGKMFDQLLCDLFSKIWITYRKNFVPILQSHYRSDAGWGCMIRTTQMMVAQALIYYYFDYCWNITHLTNDMSQIDIYKKIIVMFNDHIDTNTKKKKSLSKDKTNDKNNKNDENDKNNENNDKKKFDLSIHHMMSNGECFGKKVGTWFGPNETCFMISKCINKAFGGNNESKIVSDVLSQTGGVLYKDDLLGKCGNFENESKNTSLLIFIPLRLGLDSINSEYYESILECFEFRQSIGIVGGKPQRSLYFIGYEYDKENEKKYENSKLFYLDPHSVFDSRKCVNHCQEINSLKITELDPSMAVGFFIKNKNEFDSFWEKAESMQASKAKVKKLNIFTVSDKKPTFYDDIDTLSDDCDDIDSQMQSQSQSSQQIANANTNNQNNQNTPCINDKDKDKSKNKEREKEKNKSNGDTSSNLNKSNTEQSYTGESDDWEKI